MLRLRTSYQRLLAPLVAGLVLVISSIRAEEYTQDFEGHPDGTTDLEDGTELSSNNGAASVQSGALQLTSQATTGTRAAFRMPSLGNEAVDSWSARFDLALLGPARPADGFSLSWGEIPATEFTDENGFTEGLAVSFDTNDNNGEDGLGNGVGYDVYVNGELVPDASFRIDNQNWLDNEAYVFDGVFRSAEIIWRKTGEDTGEVSFAMNARQIFDSVPVTGFTPTADYTFAFGARTGGRSETVLLDNFEFSAPEADPSVRDPKVGGDRAVALVAAVGQTRTGQVIVTNEGESKDLELTAGELVGTDAVNFAFDAVFPITIAPGASTSIPVTFTAPATKGTYLADLSITNNDTLARARNQVVRLEGIAFEGDGSYAQNFDSFENDTTDLGDGSTITSTKSAASVQDSALRLSADGTASSLSGFVLPFLGDGGNQAFIVTFDLALTAEATPADGFSFTYGSILENATGSEAGIGLGLSTQFDAYDNGAANEQDMPGIGFDIAVAGTIIPDGSNRIAVDDDPKDNAHFRYDGVFRPVEIAWFRVGEDSGLLTLTVDGVTFFENLPTPGFTPEPTYRMGFGARTGGATETVLIDNLKVISGTEDPNLFVRDQLDVGVIQSDSELLTLSIPIRNTGSETPLTISSVTLSNNAAFTLGAVPTSVPPTEVAIVEVNLDPSQVVGLSAATLTIVSDDPSTPMQTIHLTVSVPVSAALAAWYTFDETEGTDVLDASGNGLHGSYVATEGGTFELGAPGLATGTAVRLTPGDGVVYADIPSFPANQSLSVSLWAKREGMNRTEVYSLFGKSLNDGTSPYSLATFETLDNTLAWIAGENAENIDVATPGQAMTEATHIVITHEDTNGEVEGAVLTRLFIDGELATEVTDSVGFADQVGGLQIGARLAENGFAGVIDDFQIYNRVLTSEEVSSLFSEPGSVIGAGTVVEPPVDGDTDGDGASDALEEIAGTDPNDSTSYFRSTEASRESDGFTFTWTSVPGKSYRIEYSTTLNDWVEVATMDSGGATTSFTDNDATRLEGYYRVATGN